MSEVEPNRFFKLFSEASQAGLCARAERWECGADTVLFEEGATARDIYLVQTGAVELYRLRSDQGRERFAVVGAGDYFGEVGLLGGVARSTSAVTLETSQLWRIPREPILEALRAEPGAVVLELFQHIAPYLQHSNQRLMDEMVRKEKMQLLGEMAGTIIHDFKNPIAGIRLAAEWLEEKHHDAETRRCAQLMVQQADRMVDMAQELLDFSRGQPSLVKERVSLQNLLEQFQELNEQFLQQAKVRLEICPSTVILSADAGRLLRVLQNLVGNAADAMAPAGGRILLDVRETDAVVELMIQDEGPGIPEAIREHLFEPFVTHGKRHGTGLGLAIVKATVEAHGGSIRFETALGAGTTFFLQLPRT